MKNTIIKIVFFIGGASVHFVVNTTFATVVAPYFILNFSFWLSFVLLYVINLTKNWIMIYLYDRTRTDWFRVEHKKRERGTGSTILQIVMVNEETTFVKKFRTLFIIWVFILPDAMLLTVYLREGSHQYNGIPKNVLWAFLLSVLASTLSIVVGMSGAIALIEFLSPYFWIIVHIVLTV